MDVIEPSYGRGWYDEERHDSQTFRWIAGQAHCRLPVPSSSALLRVVTAHGQPGESRSLSVSVNGRQVGSRIVHDRLSTLLFRLPQSGAVPSEESGESDIVLSVDRTFVPPGDPRELGVMVRSLDVVDLSTSEAAIEGGGWHELEHHEYFPFRWMGAQAELVLPARLRRRGRFASLPVCSDVQDGDQVLELLGDGKPIARLDLLFSWHVYDVELPAVGDSADALGLTLSVNRLVPDHVKGPDARDLGVRVGALSVHDDGRRHHQVQLLQQAFAGRPAGAGNSRVPETLHARPDAVTAASEAAWASAAESAGNAANVADGTLPPDADGWYWWEFRDYVPYRWMARQARVKAAADGPGGARYLAVPIFSEYANLAQVMTIRVGGRTAAEVPLLHRWHEYHVVVPEPRGGEIEVAFSVNKVVPPAFTPGDNRELGARVGQVRFHDDDEQFARSRWFHENAVRNERELDDGATTLESYPLSLGIDLFGKCNIKPPCVYCPWEQMKDLEGGAVDAVVDQETFERYGRFFDGAGNLVNCSFGEPLLHPRFAEVLDFFASRGKTLEISTNGQAFTPATVRALAGKPIKVFVSLDSASPETYARLRNNRWHDILAGLTVLREARRRASWLPTLHMVFMPMRANVGDLEAFVKLCRMVDADTLMLRPLQLEDAGEPAERGGYRYDYANEQLSNDELARVFEDCDRWCRQHGVTVVKQFDFGKTEPERRRLEAGANP